jgi:rhodanese-related sulfurtransferase
MENLGLPHPKQIDVAEPANLRAGKPVSGAPPRGASFGPVVTTYAGLWEIAPEWVARHLNEIQVLDVRTREEFDGELGHVPGARLIPLDELRTRVSEIADEKPVVVVCQTGKRSAMATVILRKAGLTRVANLAGGMVRFRELG